MLLPILIAVLFATQACAQLDWWPKKKGKRPDNIILFLTQDHDSRLHTIEVMENVRNQMLWNGVEFVNHFTPVSHGGASRASIFRGQHAHNTNITGWQAPGLDAFANEDRGGYAKWVAQGLNDDYLPFWMKNAGYRTEFIGKFMDGYDVAMYDKPPNGWDMADVLVEPWGKIYNKPVFSRDGRMPIYYKGRHSTDVIRAKALARLEFLLNRRVQKRPFFLVIAPHAIQGSIVPHEATHGSREAAWVPLAAGRHRRNWRGMKAPRTANYNPSDNFALQKSSWVSFLPGLSVRQRSQTDKHHRRRLQCLESVDELVGDVYNFLRKKRELHSTWMVYTSDSGYHLGNHRARAGKGLPYMEDVKVPLIIKWPREPPVIAGRAISPVVSTHLDLAPTFLEISRLPRIMWPNYLDGRSMLALWDKSSRRPEREDLHRIVHGEFWGQPLIEAGRFEYMYALNAVAYKSLRVFDEADSWLYVRWCNGEVELYNTVTDPDELKNLVTDVQPKKALDRIMQRLDALLMVTKSCSGGTCRNPWYELQRECRKSRLCSTSVPMFRDWETAMSSAFDPFFEDLPKVSFLNCLETLHADNERPHIPASPRFGADARATPHHFRVPVRDKTRRLMGTMKIVGRQEQRNEPLLNMTWEAVELREKDLGRLRVGFELTLPTEGMEGNLKAEVTAYEQGWDDAADEFDERRGGNLTVEEVEDKKRDDAMEDASEDEGQDDAKNDEFEDEGQDDTMEDESKDKGRGNLTAQQGG